jgi:hypothetical protein
MFILFRAYSIVDGTCLLSRCLATPSVPTNSKARLQFCQCAGGTEEKCEGPMNDTPKIRVFWNRSPLVVPCNEAVTSEQYITSTFRDKEKANKEIVILCKI